MLKKLNTYNIKKYNDPVHVRISIAKPKKERRKSQPSASGPCWRKFKTIRVSEREMMAISCCYNSKNANI